MHPGEGFEHRPRRIEFAAVNAKARGRGIGVMIVVPAFAGGEPGDKTEISGGVVEVAFAEGVIGAVDDGVQENVEAGLNNESDAAPERAEEQHKNGDAEENADDAEAQNVAVKPIVANVRSERSQRFGIFCLAVVVINIAEQNAPKALEHGTMRIALDVSVTVMLAMHSDPFLRVDSGPQPELQAHRESNDGVKVNTTMSESAMQIDARGERGELNDHNYSHNGIQEVYQKTLIPCASSFESGQPRIDWRRGAVKHYMKQIFQNVGMAAVKMGDCPHDDF